MEEDGRNRAAQELVSIRWRQATAEQRQRLGRALTAARVSGRVGRYVLGCGKCSRPAISADGDDFSVVLEEARLHAKALGHDGNVTIMDTKARPGQPQIFRVEGGKALVEESLPTTIWNVKKPV